MSKHHTKTIQNLSKTTLKPAQVKNPSFRQGQNSIQTMNLPSKAVYQDGYPSNPAQPSNPRPLLIKLPVSARSSKALPLKLLGQYLPIIVFSLSVFSAWVMGKVYYDNFWNIFLGLMIEVLPFFLIGAILAAVIAPLRLSELKIWRLATRNRANATATALGMGLLLPVCECGTASIARQTNRAGAPVIMSLVFLLAAPILNPITLLVTYLAFQGDWLIIFGRAGLALLVALTVGLLLSFYPNPADLFRLKTDGKTPDASDHDHDHDHGHKIHLEGEGEKSLLLFPRSKSVAFNSFLERASEECLEAVRAGLPGISMAAAFQACVPSHYFLDFGQGGLLSAVALMLLAALMSICSSADAFVALSFSGLLPTGSILAFLVFGPLINLKSIFLFRLVLTWRTIGLIAILTFSLVLVAAVFFNYWVA